jgi:alkanesulfonate monooxygenase SsuD/methylene tetrahydromethanopterin reductase-like flavin-dependent oxidoreductase (luciferase family)
VSSDHTGDNVRADNQGAPVRIATTVPQDDLRKVKDAARAAESDGYALITTNENKHDPFLPLAIAAVETERLELATAIAISFSRSPMAVANASWDLNEASRGRFILGLGTQVKAHNERRFSVPWTPPAPRMREYIRGLKAIWRCWRHGEKLAFEGEHYRFTLAPGDSRGRWPCYAAGRGRGGGRGPAAPVLHEEVRRRDGDA